MAVTAIFKIISDIKFSLLVEQKIQRDTSQPVYAVVQKKSKDKPDKERSSDVTSQMTQGNACTPFLFGSF